MTRPEDTGAFAALTERGVPPEKAVAKIQSTRRGILFLVAGAVFMVGAFAFVIYTMTVTEGAANVSTLIFALLPGLLGFYLGLAGGHLISADAMQAAEASGSIITRTAAKALTIARGKEPPAGA